MAKKKTKSISKTGLPFVYIEWVDSQAVMDSGPWTSNKHVMESVKSPGHGVCYSCGIMLYEDDNWIVVVDTIGQMDSGRGLESVDSIGNIAIPKIATTMIKYFN